MDEENLICTSDTDTYDTLCYTKIVEGAYNQRMHSKPGNQKVISDKAVLEAKQSSRKSFKSKKYLLIISGIVLFLAIAGVGRYLTGNTDITSITNNDSLVMPIVLNTTSTLAIIPDEFREIREITFSKDGRHVAYEAVVGDKSIVVLDGKEGKQYDNIFDITFSDDGEKLVYIGRLDNKSFIILNGEEYKREDGHIRGIAFSPDGNLIAYELYTIPGRRSLLVVGDQIFEDFDSHGSFSESFTFSQDSKKAAWVNRDLSSETGRCGWFRSTKMEAGVKKCVNYYITTIDLNSQKVSPLNGKLYDSIDGLVFSQDGRKLFYHATRGERTTADHSIFHRNFFGVNDYETELLNKQGSSPFSINTDGQFVYIAYDDAGNDFLTIGEKEFQLDYNYSLVTAIVLSPDGKRNAFGVQNHISLPDSYMIVDGQKERTYTNLGSPVFSPDSQKVAYFAKLDNKQFIVIDGKEKEVSGTAYTAPVFSSDSKMVGYGVRVGNKLEWILDSVE